MYVQIPLQGGVVIHMCGACILRNSTPQLSSPTGCVFVCNELTKIQTSLVVWGQIVAAAGGLNHLD